MSDGKTKILLLDSNSLVHRAYHALPMLKTSKGFYTGAIYGFLTIFLRLIKEQKPTNVVAAFDVHGGTFRNQLYPEYKANRKPMDEELHMQIEPLKQLLADMGVKVVTKQGYEGDDVLGTLAARFDEDTIIVSGDRDTFQLASDSTKIFWTKKGVSEIEIVDLDKLKEDGFTPETYIDFKALRGDASDNIPGVAGVGDKTAKDLLDRFGTLDGVLEHAGEVKGKLGETLLHSADIAHLSRTLATICTTAPLDCNLEDTAFVPTYPDSVRRQLLEWEMGSIAARMNFEAGFTQNDLLETAKIEKTVIDVKKSDEIKKAVENCDKVALWIDENVNFAVSADKEYKINCVQDLFSDGLSFDESVSDFLDAVKDKTLICFDAKALMKTYGFEQAKFFDVMIATHLAREGATVKNADAVFGSEGLEKGAAELYALADKLALQLKNKNLEKLFFEVEQPLAVVLKRMEERGFALNGEQLDRLGAKYQTILDGLVKKIYESVGFEFNIASPKQLGEVLFDRLQLPHGKKTKTGYSVNEDVLTSLKGAHPVADMILEWRHYQKLLSTYINGLKPLITHGRIHTEFNQCITATGRLSSTNPNLQNIPARGEEAKDIKSAFVPSPNGVLVNADYSQIELRMLAHMSADEALIEAYANAQDIHAATAAEIFHVKIDEVTSAQRRDAKAVNFGIVYGMSDFGLSQSISVPKRVAKEYIDHYFEMHPKVREYLDGTITFAREHGYAETLLGRRRALVEINSSQFMVRSGAERMAMNSPLQGSAADIVKLAMLGVEKRLANMKSKMILQVHDELIVDATEDEKDKVAQILKEEMENVVKLRVPLVVSVGIGKNWGELK